MRKIHRSIAVATVMMLFAATAFAGGAQEGANPEREAVDLEGAGASFVAPLMTAWADEYRDMTGGRVTVNYQSIGSGGGIRQFLEQTIMYGATEAHLTDEQMADVETRTGGRAFNIPVSLGAVVPTYNVPGVDSGLVFDGALLADIFMGEITSWDDERIRELNPDADLPELAITIVHRSDGSGTTNIWTNYLSKVSGKWAEEIGFGTSVSWPSGIGGNGNEGVAGAVMTNEGAIGYNSLIYATGNNIPYGRIVNRSGNTIDASIVTAGNAANTELPDDARALVTDTTASDGWPAAGFVWVLVYERFDENDAISTRQEAEELLRFLTWMVADGQQMSNDLDFARLEERPMNLSLSMLRQVTWNGERLGEAIVDEIAGM